MGSNIYWISIAGAVYAIVLVKPIADALVKAGVLRGTEVAREEAAALAGPATAA
jgi:energy-coupling factor transport system substrate-specific component